jgi:hypothetical protein
MFGREITITPKKDAAEVFRGKRLDHDAITDQLSEGMSKIFFCTKGKWTSAQGGC